jgi:DNA-binding winged helix-turn-helix (wHTH) protein/tetratricopeptide (TPR) repeat protein
MHYIFGDYTLDSASFLLTHKGKALELGRRVFECLNYLLEHRQRAVSRDELIRKLWGRDNVSDNQLAQVVVAARRVLGDECAAQRLIRTVPGFGYHWVGAVEVAPATPVEVASAAPLPALLEVLAPTPEPATATVVTVAAAAPFSEPITVPAIQQRPARKRHAMLCLALVLLVGGAISWQLSAVAPVTPVTPAQLVASSTAVADPLKHLEQTRKKGQLEEVRAGLLDLPVELADSPKARMLEIQLDIDRGRWSFAREKLTREQTRAKAAADPVWQIKLLLLQSTLNLRTPEPGVDRLASAQSALDLLESAPSLVSPQLLAEALSSRGTALARMGQLDDATADFARARNLYLSVDDKLRAADASTNLARIWMRRGRLLEALEHMNANAKFYAQSHHPVEEIFAHNSALRIQVELLRWNDALNSSDRSMQLLSAVPTSERRARTLQLRALALTGLGRLREAKVMLEEAGHQYPDDILIISTVYYLASAQNAQALRTATAAFALHNNKDVSDVFLENRDGALLLWMIAAQRLAAEGKPMPALTPAQLAALQQAESNVGRIARGRWLWSLGKSQQAEAELRLALVQARQMNLLNRMLLASEPLVELLLERGETAAAAQVLADLHAHDPERVEQDYQASVLGLRVALALGQRMAIVAAYQRTTALAGERVLPISISMAYKTAAP